MLRREHVKVKLAPRRIDGWRPRNATIRLVPERSVSGRAVRRDGTPADGAEGTLWTWCHDAGWDSVAIQEDGSFEQSNLPPGPVALVWTPPGEDPRDVSDLTPERLGRPLLRVAAGDVGIVFEVPRR